MPRNIQSVEQGVLAIKFDGFWTTKEFAEFLGTIDRAYSRLSSLLPLSPEFDDFIVSIAHEHSSPPWLGVPRFQRRLQDSFESIVSAASRQIIPLEMYSVHYGSPGLIEFFGNLNPLKLIADFISQWRRENTARMDIDARYDIERRRIETFERVLEREQFLKSKGPSEFIERFIIWSHDDSLKEIAALARDFRIDGVEAGDVSVTSSQGTPPHSSEEPTPEVTA